MASVLLCNFYCYFLLVWQLTASVNTNTIADIKKVCIYFAFHLENARKCLQDTAQMAKGNTRNPLLSYTTAGDDYYQQISQPTRCGYVDLHLNTLLLFLAHVFYPARFYILHPRLHHHAELVGSPVTGEDDKSSHYSFSLYRLHI